MLHGLWARDTPQGALIRLVLGLSASWDIRVFFFNYRSLEHFGSGEMHELGEDYA